MHTSLLRFARNLSAAAGLMYLVGVAHAAPGDSIGSAVTVVSLVTANLNQEQRRLSAGDDVRQQDLIEVAPEGRSELLLRDSTKVALGPGARLLLDTFVYDPDISGGAIVLNLVHGAFRFLTGVAAKPAYVVRTPTASITVRGTIFDVYVDANSVTWVLLLEGAIEACAKNGACRVLDEPGRLIRIGPDEVGRPTRWATLTRPGVTFASAFPFVFDPPRIAPDPILTLTDIVGDPVPPASPPPPIDVPRRTDSKANATRPYAPHGADDVHGRREHHEPRVYKWHPRKHYHTWDRRRGHHYKRRIARRYTYRMMRRAVARFVHRRRY